MSDLDTDQIDLPTVLQTAGTLKESTMSWLLSTQPSLVGTRLALLATTHPSAHARQYLAALAEAMDDRVLAITRVGYANMQQLFELIAQRQGADPQDMQVSQDDLCQALEDHEQLIRASMHDWPELTQIIEAHERLAGAQHALNALRAYDLTNGQAQMVGVVSQRLDRGDAGVVQLLLLIHELVDEL